MKKNWWRSLQVKIIAWSFVPTVIILSAVAWFTFYSYQKVLGDLAIKQYPDISQPKVQKFGDGINAFIRVPLLFIYTEMARNADLPIEARVQHMLDTVTGIEIFDGGLYFLDQQGKVFRSEPPLPELIGQDWSGTPYFRSLQEMPNLSSSSDLISIGSSGKKILCFPGAMADQTYQTFFGAFYSCVNIYPPTENAYYQAMKNLDLGPNFYVVDRNQQVIYSPDLSEMGKDLSAQAYMQALSPGEKKSGRFQIDGEDRVVSYVPLAGAPSNRVGWYVVTEQPWAEVMQPSELYRRLLNILLALGVIVPVLVTAYGVRHITQPIQKLIRATEQVTAGQFKQRIEVKTGDEIETLADQFNLMSAELDDSYASLEKKVADRTRELAILNAIISVAGQSLEVHEILQDALEKTVEQMGFEAGAAYRVEPGSGLPLLVTQIGIEPAAAADLFNHCSIARREISAPGPSEVTCYGTDGSQEAEVADLLRQAGFRLLVCVPLTTKGRTLGLFLLGRRQQSQLSVEELTLLSSIGKQVGVAMENARLYEQAEHAAIAAERNRLARELHDAVTQTLFSANLIADVIPRLWQRSPEEGMHNLEELRQLTRGALAEMRTLLLEMRPEALERSELKALLAQLADAFIGRARIALDLQMNGECALTQEGKTVFYRVAQEALNNIAKHSGARHASLHLDCQPGQVRLRIQDDGLGFEPGAITPDHMGMAIMRERAGSIGADLQIESQPGLGTTVQLDWRVSQKDGNDGSSAQNPGDAGR